MSKEQVKHQASTTEHQDASAPTTDRRIGQRGPKGVDLNALIFVKAALNPKRPGSKAHQVFSHYKSGTTVGAFIDHMTELGLSKEATPNLVYDVNHGFIEIENYTPARPYTPKERAPKAAAKPKASKAKKATAKAEAPAVEADVVEETIG